MHRAMCLGEAGLLPNDGACTSQRRQAARGAKGRHGSCSFARLQMKGELLDALKPTPDMVNKIAQNKELLAGGSGGPCMGGPAQALRARHAPHAYARCAGPGFEDPEVMAAVNDVAQNPGNMKKYKDNPKVCTGSGHVLRGLLAPRPLRRATIISSSCTAPQVLAFYAAMGQMMGQKLEEKGMGGPGVMKK